MHLKIKELFKGNNISILLKYDGEWASDLHTVMLFDKDRLERILGGDTDSPLAVLNSIFTHLQSEKSDELTQYYFQIFKKMVDKLNDVIDTQLVFLLIAEGEEGKVIYKVVVISNKTTQHFERTDLEMCSEEISKNYMRYI